MASSKSTTVSAASKADAEAEEIVTSSDADPPLAALAADLDVSWLVPRHEGVPAEGVSSEAEATRMYDAGGGKSSSHLVIRHTVKP